MRNIFSIILIVILTSVSCSKKLATTLDADPRQMMTTDITLLASDEMEGREVGTPGEEKAAKYIAQRFSDMGIKPNGDKGSYFQHFSKKIKSNPHSMEASASDTEIKGKNVVAFIDHKAKYTVVLGAHYDHLGYGEEGSLHTGEKEIHNGADDNASGVSALLHLAYMLKSDAYKGNNYIFIAFSGEEKGLWGSNYFVNHPSVPIDKINYMINMDMLGRLNSEKQLVVNGVGTSPDFSKILDQSNVYKLKLKKEQSGVGPSDFTSFYLQNVPVLSFFTGQHEHYHKPTDDVHTLNFSGLKDVTDFILKVVSNLDDKGKMSFTKTKDESTEAPKFTVTLGVIPDYLYDGKGMRIDGVREGKPAHKADLLKGDVILKMNDIDVIDMMSYMKALSSFKAGDTAKLLIIRQGKEIEKEVKF